MSDNDILTQFLRDNNPETLRAENAALKDELLRMISVAKQRGDELMRVDKERDALKAALAKAREALIDQASHMAAATSAYEKFVARHHRRGQSDPLFGTRIQDFRNAVKRGHAALAALKSPAQGEGG